MPDTVVFQTTTATPPDGTVISTEEVTTLNGGVVTAQQVQRVAVALRTANSTAVDLPGSTADGLLVNLGANNDVTVSAASLPLPSGAATSANQDTSNTRVGALDETAPASDTASGGLNGRLQRLAQRITSLIALLPTSIGQKAKAASLAVTLASDQDALPVNDNGGSLTVDGTVAVSGTVTVGATNLDIRDLTSASDNVAAAQSGVWSVTADTELPTAAALADNAANPTAPAVGAFAMVWDGSTWDRAPGTAADGLTVNLGGNNDVTVTGTVTVGAALPAGTNNIGDVDVLTLPAATNAGATAKTADYDTGAGTDTVTQFGIALPASGGAVAGGTSTNPLRTDPTGTTAQPVTDNGGSLTVDGTVAATQSGTWTVQPGNTANSTAWLVTGTGGSFPVTDSSGSLTVDAPVGAPVNVQIGDGSNTATIRNLSANDALNVSIVDGSGNQITSFGGSGGTSATDDAAFTAGSGLGTPLMGFATADAVDSGDVGVVGMTVNRALYSTLRTPNNDSAMDDTNDAVRVNVVAGSGGGVTHADDAAFTAGTDDGVPIFGFFNDSTPDSVTEGDAGAVRMSGNRNLYTTIRDAAGNERGLNVDASGRIGVTDGGSSLTVDATALDIRALASGTDSVAATQSGTWNVTNVSGTVSLPTGAATAAKQPALGTAGSASADVITVQGVASMTPLLVNGSGATQPVSGTVTANLAAGTNNIGDVDVLSVVPGTGATALGKAEDAAHATGDTGIAVWGVRNDAAATTFGADGDYTPLATDSAGRVGISDLGGSLTVDNGGTFAVQAAQSGTWNVGTVTAVTAISNALPAGTNNIGDVDILSIAAGDNNIGNVDVVTLPALAAGSNNIGDVDIASGPTGASALHIQGPASHDAAAAGSPLIIGGVAESTRPAAVADADAVQAWFDLVGRQVVQIGSSQFSYVAAEYTSNQTDTELIAAPGASLAITIYDIVVSTGTAGTVLLEDSTATRLFGRLSLAANGGWSFNSAKGVRLTANQSLTITTTTGAGPLAITVNYAATAA